MKSRYTHLLIYPLMATSMIAMPLATIRISNQVSQESLSIDAPLPLEDRTGHLFELLRQTNVEDGLEHIEDVVYPATREEERKIFEKHSSDWQDISIISASFDDQGRFKREFVIINRYGYSDKLSRLASVWGRRIEN